MRAAERMIRAAGDLAQAHFDARDRLVIQTKTDGQDLVSAADREVEALLRTAIAAEFPDDGMVGEEQGATAGTSGFTWVIDPIDGTSVFLHGLPYWTVVIAIYEGEEVCGALILHPATATLYMGRRGHGAQVVKDGLCKTLAVSEMPFTSSLYAIGMGDAGAVAEVIERVIAQGGAHMRIGSAALTLAHVASGHYGGFYESRLSIWDCAAGLLLVREAGGVTGSPPVLSSHGERRPCFAATAVSAPVFTQCVGGI